MPRFAANVAYLFSERPLIERFAAAAAAGTDAVLTDVDLTLAILTSEDYQKRQAKLAPKDIGPTPNAELASEIDSDVESEIGFDDETDVTDEAPASDENFSPTLH